MDTIENTGQDEIKDDMMLHEKASRIRKEIHKVLVGQSDTVDLMLISLFTGGHVLIEGVPGIAKTLMAKLLAKTLAIAFSRIQFTPDLMPADILGTMVFNMKTSDFEFNRGPVFSNLVLIDEINRAPAKTQAALFEVMEEKQITIDGVTHMMEQPFIVVATQNPIEQEGTYKLPEAQLDRFLFRIRTSYPSPAEELEMLIRFRSDFDMKITEDVGKVISPEEIANGRSMVQDVIIRDELLHYITEIIGKTRNNPDLFLGGSPRASIAIMKSSKAFAAIHGRNYVTPDDIRFVIPHVLNHRVILSAEKELEGVFPEDVLYEIIDKVEVPR